MSIENRSTRSIIQKIRKIRDCPRLTSRQKAFTITQLESKLAFACEGMSEEDKQAIQEAMLKEIVARKYEPQNDLTSVLLATSLGLLILLTVVSLTFLF